MPKTNKGWRIVDIQILTHNELAKIRKLISDGKEAEARKLLTSILKKKRLIS